MRPCAILPVWRDRPSSGRYAPEGCSGHDTRAVWWRPVHHHHLQVRRQEHHQWFFSSKTEIERKSWSSWKLSEILFVMLILQVVIWRYIRGSLEIVSPSAVIVYLENIGFVYPAMSMMANRSFAPILRQSRWSLLYDVYWLEMMMLNTWTGTTGYFFCLTGNRQRDRNTWTWFRIRVVIFLFWTK